MALFDRYQSHPRRKRRAKGFVVKICILAAGAGGMYCGSCMRDNALASALKRMGHGVTLIPLYTPLKTDAPRVSGGKVFFGGINIYSQHVSPLFRPRPHSLAWRLLRTR